MHSYFKWNFRRLLLLHICIKQSCQYCSVLMIYHLCHISPCTSEVTREYLCAGFYKWYTLLKFPKVIFTVCICIKPFCQYCSVLMIYYLCHIDQVRLQGDFFVVGSTDDILYWNFAKSFYCVSSSNYFTNTVLCWSLSAIPFSPSTSEFMWYARGDKLYWTFPKSSFLHICIKSFCRYCSAL